MLVQEDINIGRLGMLAVFKYWGQPVLNSFLP